MKPFYKRINLLFLFVFISILWFPSLIFPQDFWQQTTGPGNVEIGDLLFKDGDIFAGVWHGGIYKSTDDGNSWTQLQNEFRGYTIWSFIINNENNIVTGTDFNGIYISSDNGVNWQHTGIDNESVLTLTSDANGNLFAGTISPGNLYKSTDNGYTWSLINTGFDLPLIYSIAIKDTTKIFVASSTAIIRSLDGGNTWVQDQNIFAIDVKIHPSGDVFIVSQDGIVRYSTDDGNTWIQTSGMLQNVTVRTINIDSFGNLYAGTSGGIYKSTDYGNSWTLIDQNYETGYIRVIKFNNGNIYAGTYFRGIFLTTNGGSSWQELNHGLNASGVNLFTQSSDGRIISSAYIGGLSFTTDNGNVWFLLNELSNLNSLVNSPNGVLFASNSGPYGTVYRSFDNGSTWESVVVTGYDTTVQTVKASPNGTVFALINYKLNRSFDNGDVWEPVQVSSENNSFGNIFISNNGTLFIGNLYRSTDEGNSWELLNSAPANMEIIGISKIDDIYGRVSDDGKIYRSGDYGDTWLNVNNGFGSDNILSFASNDRGDVFINVYSQGVYRSNDRGETWQTINSGLNGASVSSLFVSDDDYLYAGTSFNGVFRSVGVTTDIKSEGNPVFTDYKLFQNYPNPFNPSTKIKFKIPSFSKGVSGRSEDGGFTTLKVYDILGNEVNTLINKNLSPGTYEVEFNATGLTSGVYFYQLKTGSFTQTRKMILLR